MNVPDIIASYFTLAGDTQPWLTDGPSPIDFHVRVESAAKAGFSGIGLYHSDLPHVIERYGYAEMRRILNANGMRFVELEALIDWFADGERRIRSDAARLLLMTAAGELEACHIKCAGDFVGDCSDARMIPEFGELCLDAARCGTRIALEVAPISNIATLERARNIVEGAAHLSGGLLLDNWHLQRAGIGCSEIASLPGRLIFGAELSDAAAENEGTLTEDTVTRRRFCGDGGLEIPAFIASVRATGYAGPFGVELLSDAIRAMPTEEVATRAFATAARQFESVGAAC